MAQSKFSRINTPDFYVAPDFGEHPRFQTDDSPRPLIHQRNFWQIYFGDFPRFCALITDEQNIQKRIADGARHVVSVPVNTTESPFMVHLPQRDIMDKVARIIHQLEKLGLEWHKEASHFVINLEEYINMDLFVCDDSGMFHVLIYRDMILADGLLVHPESTTDKINQLILCIRSIFLDCDPFDELPLLRKPLWDASVHMTFAPDFDKVEFYPEWMDDDNSDWNFPETEPFEQMI